MGFLVVASEVEGVMISMCGGQTSPMVTETFAYVEYWPASLSSIPSSTREIGANSDFWRYLADAENPNYRPKEILNDSDRAPIVTKQALIQTFSRKSELELLF